MIRTKREYDVTAVQAEKFRSSLAAMQDGGGHMVEIQRSAMQSQLDDLTAELREYDARVAESLR